MKKQNDEIKYVLTKSSLETALGKYFALVLNNGTHDLAAMSAKMQDGRPAIEDADVKLTVATLVDAIVEEVVTNHNRVDLGLFSVELAINGSMPSMDSPLSEENEIYILLTASGALRSEVGRIVPSRASSNKVTVKMENVEDVATHRKAIRGLDEFVVTGSGLSANRDGESLTLCKEDGTTVSPVTVLDKDGNGERIYAKLATAVEPGAYVLHLTTHGYLTPDADAEKYTRNVSLENGGE